MKIYKENLMEPVKTLKELTANVQILDEYLNSKSDPEFMFALNLVKRGTCFYVTKNGDNVYRFYPSRFIGYVCNNMDAHMNNQEKNGRETNSAIFNILGARPIPNTMLDKLYRDYCISLGFVANAKGSFGVERKYLRI